MSEKIVHEKQTNCPYCGSDDHKPEDCNMKKWADYLTGKSDETPEGRELIITEGEDELVNAVEEAHALKHIKEVKRS